MDRNQLRKNLQRDAANALHDKKRLLIRWATGTGKTGVIMEFLKAHPETGNVLIVVPEVNNIENWEHEFDKFNVSRNNVTIICYASLKNYIDTSWDLLCLDEAPHSNTDIRLSILETIKADYVIALGAVITEEEQAMLTMIYGEFTTSRVTLDMAIASGILPSPVVKVCHMSLDNTVRRYCYNGIMKTAKEAYDVINDKVTRAVKAYNTEATTWNKLTMQRLGSERKRFLGEQKTYAIDFICDQLRRRSKRFLCFCSSIEQAKTLGGDKAFTSKTPASMHVLDKFNNHEIDSLYVVGKLIEGQNLKDIDCGVIGQLGGKERITTQSIGRIMRSDSPVIYVPVFDGTKDDGFLRSLTASISSQYIKHYKL